MTSDDMFEIKPSVAEQRLWDLLSTRLEGAPDVEQFVADTERQIANALNVAVSDLEGVRDDRRAWLRTVRNPGWEGPATVVLRLPDADGEAHRVEIARAWPGTADPEWCIERHTRNLGNPQTTKIMTWYFRAMTTGNLRRAAQGVMPHDARIGETRYGYDAYGRSKS